jgi:hypothetical protein
MKKSCLTLQIEITERKLLEFAVGPHKVRPKNVYVLFTEKGNIIIGWYYYCENYKLIFQKFFFF